MRAWLGAAPIRMTPLLRNRLARKQRLSLAVLLLLVLAASMMLLAIPPADSGSHAVESSRPERAPAGPPVRKSAAQPAEPEAQALLTPTATPSAEMPLAQESSGVESPEPLPSMGMRAWLETCLVDLHSAGPEQRERVVERALATSVAALLDAQARSLAIESVPGGVLARVPRGQEAFQMNSRYYRFARGEFPEYDLLLDFKRQHLAWAEQRPPSGDVSAWEAREPVFPTELVALATQRVEQALAQLP